MSSRGRDALRGVLVTLLATGCSAVEVRSGPQFREHDTVANYRRIFDADPPADVEIVHALIVVYPWDRWYANVTHDFAFEIVAPPSWIEARLQDLHLKRLEMDEPGFAEPVIRGRQRDPVHPWYAPDPYESYEAYYDYRTSHPYVHLLVARQPEPDGRRRVFLSKH